MLYDTIDIGKSKPVKRDDTAFVKTWAINSEKMIQLRDKRKQFCKIYIIARWQLLSFSYPYADCEPQYWLGRQQLFYRFLWTKFKQQNFKEYSFRSLILKTPIFLIKSSSLHFIEFRNYWLPVDQF